MLVLVSGTERCVLSAGTYTVGGRGSEALPLAALEGFPAVATIVVPPDGPATIQRLIASVVVRLDRNPLGIAPKELQDGAEIEFDKFRLRFWIDDGEATLTSSAPTTPAHTTPHAIGIVPAPRERAATPATTAGGARIVNVRTGESVTLGENRIVVGRDEGCDLVVSGMGVSRRHFSVAPVRGGYVLRDESANGTLVNGRPVAGSYLLGNGDVLRVDKEELRFELAGVAAPTRAADAMPTQILDLSRLRRENGTASERESAARDAMPIEASLEIVRGPFAGASFSIERAVCSIGRGAQCDVRIPDNSVSINHATIFRKGTSWFVVDLRSANGTFVDGSRVAGEREVVSGSRLKLGSVELNFRAFRHGVDVPEPKEKASWLPAGLRWPFVRPKASGSGE